MAGLNAAPALPLVLPVNPDNAVGLIAPHAPPGNAQQQALTLPQEVAPINGGNRVGAAPDAGALPQPVGPAIRPAPLVAQLGPQQGQPMVAPLVVQAAIPPPEVNAGIPGLLPNLRHTSFASFYHDAGKDPLRTRYTEVIEHFDAMAATPQTPKGLMDIELGNPSVPIKFLCCVSLPSTGRPRVCLLHLLSKYTPALDGRTTPWANRIFGFLGDVIGQNAMSVIIPYTAFNTVQCPVWNDARFTADYLALGDCDLFPWVAANNQEALLAQTWHLMYLPSKYAPLFLSNKGYGVKEALTTFHQAVTADNFVIPTAAIYTLFRTSLHATQNNN